MWPEDEQTSRSTGRPIRLGFTADGRYIGVVYEVLDDDGTVLYPVTAFVVDEE